LFDLFVSACPPLPTTHKPIRLLTSRHPSISHLPPPAFCLLPTKIEGAQHKSLSCPWRQPTTTASYREKKAKLHLLLSLMTMLSFNIFGVSLSALQMAGYVYQFHRPGGSVVMGSEITQQHHNPRKTPLTQVKETPG
jgi:hypothetical protein